MPRLMPQLREHLAGLERRAQPPTYTDWEEARREARESEADELRDLLLEIEQRTRNLVARLREANEHLTGAAVHHAAIAEAIAELE